MLLGGWGNVVRELTEPPSVEGNLTPRVQLPYRLPAKEGILDMARGNVHFEQHGWGYFAFKRLLRCSDDSSLPLVEKICYSMGFRAANRIRVDKGRSGPPAVFLYRLYFIL